MRKRNLVENSADYWLNVTAPMKETLEVIHRILESKQAERRRLAALPMDEKIALLERLRDRALAIASSDLYRAANPDGGRAARLRGDDVQLNEPKTGFNRRTLVIRSRVPSRSA